MDDLNLQPIYEATAFDHGFAPMPHDTDDEPTVTTYTGFGINHGDYRPDVAL